MMVHMFAILGPVQVSLGQFWPILEPSGHLGTIVAILARLVPSWGSFGTLLGNLGPSWGHLETSWGHLGTKGVFGNLQSRFTREIVSPSWCILGLGLGPK